MSPPVHCEYPRPSTMESAMRRRRERIKLLYRTIIPKGTLLSCRYQSLAHDRHDFRKVFDEEKVSPWFQGKMRRRKGMKKLIGHEGWDDKVLFPLPNFHRIFLWKRRKLPSGIHFERLEEKIFPLSFDKDCTQVIHKEVPDIFFLPQEFPFAPSQSDENINEKIGKQGIRSAPEAEERFSDPRNAPVHHEENSEEWMKDADNFWRCKGSKRAHNPHDVCPIREHFCALKRIRCPARNTKKVAVLNCTMIEQMLYIRSYVCHFSAFKKRRSTDTGPVPSKEAYVMFLCSFFGRAHFVNRAEEAMEVEERNPLGISIFGVFQGTPIGKPQILSWSILHKKGSALMTYEGCNPFFFRPILSFVQRGYSLR